MIVHRLTGTSETEIEHGALVTDLYQLTMAYGYWKAGIADRQAIFHLFFRNHPFQGGFTLAAGLEDALRYLQNIRFQTSDLDYLAKLTGRDGRPLFEAAFLDSLATFRFTCNVDAIPEGTVVFPHQPLVRIEGPILQAQIVETALLNILNFQSLIATKSARICLAAQGDPVMEFGLRRAQGIDGALTAARAAFIGGCSATSNVFAGKMLGIPVKGTHAHSWVMSFDNELEAFLTYAEAMPNNCIFLVDTFDTLEGVRKAVEVGRKLKTKGHAMAGIRLDSGDLAQLSIEARTILNANGFQDAVIVASNDLDEHLIESLKAQGAAINVWGVGTKLITAYDQPALGGVYKLAAIQNEQGQWIPRIKLSEQSVKVTNPGKLQVRRFKQANTFIGDALYDLFHPLPTTLEIIHPLDPTLRTVLEPETEHEDLLIPMLRQGDLVQTLPTLPEIQKRVQTQLSQMNPSTLRFLNPHRYPAGLERTLHERKTQLILQARNPGSKK